MNSTRPQAIITGGTRGIGRALCLEFAQTGYDVAFTYRSQAAAAEALTQELEKYGGRAQGFQVDMADAIALKKTMEEILKTFPCPEVLVNNAGITLDGLLLRADAADWDLVMNTNARSAMICSQCVLRPMMKARKGSIIFIGSVIGQMGNAGQTLYSASKAALIAMTKSIAKEVGSRGIRVNTVAPGFIHTDMTENLPADIKQSILAQVPLGEFGTPEDVAQAASFLASSRARYITGQIIAVNGGLYM